jgi:hypothetical protein
MDENVSPGKELACGHMVCGACTTQLRDPTCPTCRAPLAGGYINVQAQTAIAQKQQLDAKIRIMADALVAQYVQDYEDPVEGRSYADTFSEYLYANPGITDATVARLFAAFAQYVRDERNRWDGQSLLVYLPIAYKEFVPVGNHMRDNPYVSYRTARRVVLGK